MNAIIKKLLNALVISFLPVLIEVVTDLLQEAKKKIEGKA